VKTYAPQELTRFLDAVDAHLDIGVVLILIGGGAAALAYGIENATKDLDTFSAGRTPDAIERAVRRAQIATGLAIPLGPAAVADAPYDFESRLVPVLADRGWQRLALFAPERHDLVLSKLVRGVQSDMEHIAAIHQRQALDLEVLVERFTTEMAHAIGRPGSLRVNLLVCIDDLFGEVVATAVAARLDPARK
jgi:hypothetical protein